MVIMKLLRTLLTNCDAVNDMRNAIIGTAGHVDHGKTALIRALTGIDTDRLEEEKRRGITIDLGFAHINLPGFGEASIIDVPGHEKFVRNMLSGASGTDLALVVIAANEGIMPQTQEHIDILSLLNIKTGVIALTKCDITDEETIVATEKEVSGFVKGSFLENAPIIRVSALTGEGLKELKEALTVGLIKVTGASSEKNEDISREENEPFFMPIDRSFSIKGAGTVVTGTTRAGKVIKGEEYMLYPAGRKVTVRGIQIHGNDVSEGDSGQRCALNLKDIGKDEIKRGDILASKGSLPVSKMLDVKISVLENSPIALRNGEKVFAHYGSGGGIAKAVIIDSDTVEPGESGYVQLHLLEEISAREKDVFVIRSLSPVITIGGGIILDANPVRKRRKRIENVRSFEIKEKGSEEEKCTELIREHSGKFITLNELKGHIDADNAEEIIEKLRDNPSVCFLNDDKLILSDLERKLRSFLRGALVNYHMEYPDYPGMPLAEAKMKLLGRGRDKDAKALLGYWEDCEFIKEKGGCISLFEFELVVLEDDSAIAERLTKIYEEAGINPPAYNEIKPTFLGSRRFPIVLKALLNDGILVKLDERYLVDGAQIPFAMEKLRLLAEHKEGGEITLGEYRDRLKSSRKVALAFLEYFDRSGVTEKIGDSRFIKCVK